MKKQQEVFFTVVNNAIRNGLFYIITTVIIKFLYLNLGYIIISKILAVILIGLNLTGLLIFIYSILLGVVALFINLYEKDTNQWQEQKYLWAGSLVQLLENAICTYCSWILYQTIFL